MQQQKRVDTASQFDAIFFVLLALSPVRWTSPFSPGRHGIILVIIASSSSFQNGAKGKQQLHIIPDGLRCRKQIVKLNLKYNTWEALEWLGSENPRIDARWMKPFWINPGEEKKHDQSTLIFL